MRSLRMAAIYTRAFTNETETEGFGGYRGLSVKVFTDLILHPEPEIMFAAFMSASRPPDGAERPQHFNNHK